MALAEREVGLVGRRTWRAGAHRLKGSSDAPARTLRSRLGGIGRRLRRNVDAVARVSPTGSTRTVGKYSAWYSVSLRASSCTFHVLIAIRNIEDLCSGIHSCEALVPILPGCTLIRAGRGHALPFWLYQKGRNATARQFVYSVLGRHKRFSKDRLTRVQLGSCSLPIHCVTAVFTWL